jgi:hypothetical protein
VDVPDHQVGFERVRVIVVERRPLLQPEVVAIAVVAIVVEHGHPAVVDRIDDPPDDGSLARAGSARHSDHDRLHRLIILAQGSGLRAQGSWLRGSRGSVLMRPES